MGTGLPVPQMVSFVAGSYEPVCQIPPPPVFQALWSSFQVSLPGSPGLGTTYQRHNSLPVLTSSAATQPRVPPSPAPFCTITLPSATSGAVRNFSCLPNSVLPATILSHTISPLSRSIAMTRPSGRLAITRSSQSAMPRVRGALPWCLTPGSAIQTNSPLLGLRASILYTVPQPSVVYMKPLSTSGLTSFSGPFCPTSCMPPSASAQTSRRFLTLSRLIWVSLEYRVEP